MCVFIFYFIFVVHNNIKTDDNMVKGSYFRGKMNLNKLIKNKC